MENKKQIEILNNLLEINNDRVIIYSLVKNEIVYDDIKRTIAACIKSSLLCSAQLVEEKNKILSKEKSETKSENYETVSNQEFFDVWLVINENLSVHKHTLINSLFTASENVLKTTYENALNNDNLKHLSLRNKRLILRQKERLNAS